MNNECKRKCTIVFVAISQTSMRQCVQCNTYTANVSDCNEKVTDSQLNSALPAYSCSLFLSITRISRKLTNLLLNTLVTTRTYR